jgi:hypothetical protein
VELGSPGSSIIAAIHSSLNHSLRLHAKPSRKARSKERAKVQVRRDDDNDGMNGAEAAMIANGFAPEFGYGKLCEDRALNAGPLSF